MSHAPHTTPSATPDDDTILAALNDYDGPDVWNDVIWTLPLDSDLTTSLDSNDVHDGTFVLEDGRTFRWTGYTWENAGHYNDLEGHTAALASTHVVVALRVLGMSADDAAQHLDVDARRVRRWISGAADVQPFVQTELTQALQDLAENNVDDALAAAHEAARLIDAAQEWLDKALQAAKDNNTNHDAIAVAKRVPPGALNAKPPTQE